MSSLLELLCNITNLLLHWLYQILSPPLKYRFHHPTSLSLAPHMHSQVHQMLQTGNLAEKYVFAVGAY